MVILTHDFYTAFLAIAASLLAVILAYFKWSFGYWSRRGIAAPTPSIPFGNMKDILLQNVGFGNEVANVYHHMKSKGLKYCGYYFASKPILMVLDPEIMKVIMTKDFLHFTDHINYVNEKNDPIGAHLFALRGEQWKNLRTQLTPAFTTGKMKMMLQTLVDCADELIVVMDKMDQQRTPVDIKDVVGRFTTDVIGSCAFGIDCNSLKDPDSEFRRYGKKMFEDNLIDGIKALIALYFPGILDFFGIPLTKRDVAEFFMNTVKETVKYREENNIVRKDFMHLMIQLKNNVKIKDEDSVGELNNTCSKTTIESEEEKSLTIEQVAAQVFLFFIAGFETSSTTLTFCFYELVSNTDVQEKLRKEINEVLKKHDGKITYTALMDMTYMDKCINETLRKYPPIPLLARTCTKAYKLPESDVVVEKGVQVFMSILGLQHDPEYYPNPDKFDPERFSTENKAKRHPYTWLPFGDGPRVCIGLRFGVMQAKIALTVLLKSYKFTLNSKTQQPIVMDPRSFILSVQGGVWLNTEKC